MTYRQFLRIFRKTVKTKKWKVKGDRGYIRCASGLCPIEAVAVHLGHKHIARGDVWDAVGLLSMGAYDAERVIGAADNDQEHDVTRRALLTAVKSHSTRKS